MSLTPVVGGGAGGIEGLNILNLFFESFNFLTLYFWNIELSIHYICKFLSLKNSKKVFLYFCFRKFKLLLSILHNIFRKIGPFYFS